MREVLRRNWRFWVALTEILVLTAVFAHYIGHRQRLADQRNERQRQAICAILANIPGRIPPEIARARSVFADRPGQCQPIVHTNVKTTPTAAPSLSPQPRQTVVVVLTPGRSASPAASRTASPRPSPSHSPSHSPSPRPSPSPSRTPCLIPGVPPGCG